MSPVFDGGCEVGGDKEICRAGGEAGGEADDEEKGEAGARCRTNARYPRVSEHSTGRIHACSAIQSGKPHLTNKVLQLC